MDFPIFFIDGIGNRMLMAVMSILHLFINHPMAVGGYPLIVLLEWIALKRNLPKLDALAYKILFIFFIVTTSLGALTGVGMWITLSLIAPHAIGSLLRIFFWAWFIEWIVFIIEIVLVLAYTLTWRKWTSPQKKRRHIQVGILLAVMSWLTMAIITAILGFMMHPGNWSLEIPALERLGAAFLNPLYLPQLALRTPLAMVMGGLIVWLFSAFFSKRNSPERIQVVRTTSYWTLFWLPLLVLGTFFYWSQVPGYMKDFFPTALTTGAFTDWHRLLLWITIASVAFILLVSLLGAWKPKKIPAVFLIIPFCFSLWYLGHFERVREFIRKPYVIADYMYSTGIRKSEVPLLRDEGILKHATYVRYSEVTDTNKIDAGRDIFRLTCVACHTTRGINGIIPKTEYAFGDAPWDENDMADFFMVMHETHPYMPPFPGNRSEAKALTAYLNHLKKSGEALQGDQAEGIQIKRAAKS